MNNGNAPFIDSEATPLTIFPSCLKPPLASNLEIK